MTWLKNVVLCSHRFLGFLFFRRSHAWAKQLFLAYFSFLFLQMHFVCSTFQMGVFQRRPFFMVHTAPIDYFFGMCKLIKLSQMKTLAIFQCWTAQFICKTFSKGIISYYCIFRTNVTDNLWCTVIESWKYFPLWQFD